MIFEKQSKGEVHMNIGFWSCLVLGILFAIITLVFAILGEKAAILISGFNTLTKEERRLYDIKRMSSDQRNAMLLWTVIMIIGALFSYVISPYVSIGAFIIWLIVFFRDVHVDAKKAFEKYRIK